MWTTQGKSCEFVSGNVIGSGAWSTRHLSRAARIIQRKGPSMTFVNAGLGTKTGGKVNMDPARCLFCVTLVVGIWVFRAHVDAAAESTTSPAAAGDAAVQPAAPEPKAPELFKLKNEDLLKRAQAIYDKADSDYKSQLREMAAREIELADSRKELAAVVIPASPTTAESSNPSRAVERAKQRKAAAAQKLKLTQAQKSLLDQVAGALDACKSADTAYLNALDELRAYAVEIGLRVQDKTLAADQAPAALLTDSLAKKKSELEAASVTRKDRAAAVVKEQDAANKSVEEANKAALAADADLTQASNALAMEEKSQETKKQYAGKKPAELASELSALAEEGIGLKGTFELGLARFNAGANEAEKSRKVVEAMKQPEVKIPQISRPEDVEQAAAGTQKLIDFYAQRIKALESLDAALAEVLRLGSEFNADATVSTDHLFKMRSIAEVLKSAGTTDVKLIPEAEPGRVLEAERTQAKQMAGVQAAVERAKTERPGLDKQLAETRANLQTASEQLDRLKQSQSATLAALGWEVKLKDMKADQAVEAFSATAKSLREKVAAMEKRQGEYKAALATATDLTTKLDGLKDPLLRAAEEALQPEKAKILGGLRRDAGLAAPAAPTAPVASARAPADAATPAIKAAEAAKAPPVPEKKPTDLEKATTAQEAFQQLVSGRMRVLDERDRVGAALLAAISAMEKTGADYAGELAESRKLAMQWHTIAVDLKKRIGKGELSGDKAPAELAESLRPEMMTRLDADVASLLTNESHFKQLKESMQKPDAASDTGKALTRDVLALVGQRLDLLSDLRTLDAAYKIAAKDRDPGDSKRLDQEAAERQAAESSAADALLSIDTSKHSKSLVELLDSDYRELIDLEYREDNLRQQREKTEKLIELSQKEQESITKVLPVLEKVIAEQEAARDELAVLAQARVKPDQADELLRAFRAKTGRLLAKPVPIGEKDKAAQVAELANGLFEKTVQVAATRNWYTELTARLAATGIKAEMGAYQDEEAKMNAGSGANGRRIEALTGQKPPAPGSKEIAAVKSRQKFAATGGSIAKTRGELAAVRRHGVVVICIKILAILVGAIFLPRLLRPMIRRAMGYSAAADDEHGNSALLLNTLQVFVKTAIWITAIAMILSVFGFDVTAIVAGLGIGGLAIGLAAQPILADVISAVIIFAERKFTIGDVIKIGGDEPAKVVGLSWRGTQLKGPDGLVINVPNRNITSANVRNLTKDGRTFDSLSINITTQKDVASVLAVIQQATAECKYVAADSSYAVKEYQHKGNTRVIKYQFWWYLSDYEVRNRTRDEVFSRISANLSNENMAGTEVTLA